MNKDEGKRILNLQNRIVSTFNETNWSEIGLLTGYSNLIDNHHRLLRSYSWGDQDYGGNVADVLKHIAREDKNALLEIERYVDEKYPDETYYVSSKPSKKKITFSPNVFQVPEFEIEQDLIAVMMPFGAEYNKIYEAIKLGCLDAGFRCLRADDIWQESTIIQEIFNLIFRAHVVVTDFSGKNPNVMYETGIAHTLGKLVVPISQSLDDLPFDMSHHRVLKYLPNQEGLENLKNGLVEKLRYSRT